MDVSDPRRDFWAERTLSEIAGLEDEAALEILTDRMQGAMAARAAGRGPNQYDYNRIGRRLTEVYHRVANKRDVA